MSATGNLDVEASAEGNAGSPGDVTTSKNNQGAPGASASGAENTKETKETEKPKEQTPTTYINSRREPKEKAKYKERKTTKSKYPKG